MLGKLWIEFTDTPRVRRVISIWGSIVLIAFVLGAAVTTTTSRGYRVGQEILGLAATAVTTAQMNNRVFSPQNWLKSIQSVQGQMLVAGTVAGMLPQMPNSSALLEVMKAPLDGFHPRWSAD